MSLVGEKLMHVFLKHFSYLRIQSWIRKDFLQGVFMKKSSILCLFICLYIFSSCSSNHPVSTRTVASHNGMSDFSEDVVSEPLNELNMEDDIPTQYSSSHGDYSVSVDTKNRVVAFNFNNTGVNRIIPKKT